VIQILITICFMAGEEQQCHVIERAAPVSYAECVAHTEAIEFVVVQSLLTQGFPWPLMAVTAECESPAD
jgi:hypothetical protein